MRGWLDLRVRVRVPRSVILRLMDRERSSGRRLSLVVKTSHSERSFTFSFSLRDSFSRRLLASLMQDASER